ncbi:MAG: alanine racemase [Pseudomonas sp.]|uniref:alanine racemase n=1 Tax=Pseudomonas sp. TaxID=306 RepID=UPI0027258AEA|nr:alanine racemase [Pseudomonas sp.]MDO9618146.1 alanine racemase [Pseudomonas sp.]MDP2447042.1 alanine racemase [Pseudomonas sp.]MDZ4336968.1 alanine racemase [Pseudomonas sp.]
MKRRSLLGLGALGLLGGWALRPSDLGQPHTPYFAALNQLLRRAGAGLPLLVVDLERLDQNAELLAGQLGSQLPLRLVAKSLASTGLLDYLAKTLGTQRFMVFHQPQINQLAASFPQSDLLLGKPLPSAAALSFYQQLPQGSGFVPAKQLTWLIDSQTRLQEYAALANALNQPLQIAFEIDIGLARGGFATPAELGAALTWLRNTPNRLRVRGLMGYDAHLAHTPFWTDQTSDFAQSAARYRAFIASAAAFNELWPQQPLLNGAGSLTYALHTQRDTPLNEVAVGSALLKPSDFDSDLLATQQAALWIASPVLKALPGQLPFLDSSHQLLQRWNRNRQQAYYLYGGQWPATPVSPAGLSYDALYGRSANQERLIGSAGTGLQVDDWVFLRPQRSEGLFELFNQLVLLRNGRLVGSWSAGRA